MDYILLTLVFVLGLVIGSFLNVVIFRLDTENDIVNSRSKCLSCGHLLAWRDLVPVLSFLGLKGKCRYCRTKISWQYPLVEIASGLTFVALFSEVFGPFDLLALAEAIRLTFTNLLSFVALAYIFSALLLISVFDLRSYLIPDKVVYPAIAVALLWRILTAGAGSAAAVLSILGPALLAGGFFYALVLLTRGKGMGGGDVKLGFLLGLVLGFPDILLALFIAFIMGALVGVYLIRMGKKKMKSMLPFGPFLVLGFLVSFFFGSEILAWYWGVLLP